MARTESDIRGALATRLRRTIDDEIWRLLVEDRWVDDAGQTDDLDELANRYLRLTRLGTPRERKPGPPAPREIPPDARLRAISWRLGQLAGRRADVRVFRERILGGELLDYRDVAEWIDKATLADGPALPFLIVPVPAGYKVSDVEPEGIWTSPPLTISQETPAAQAPMLSLEYSSRGKGGVMRKYVAWAGVLDELRQISEALEDEYGWQKAQATTFVLTGLTPDMPGARVTFELRFGATLEARINLNIDASLPVREVTTLYRQARRDLMPPSSRRHYRRMDEKHAQLARFYSENGRSWRERMQSWNEAHLEWRYTEVRNFARDCTRANRRLFGEGE